MVDFEQVMKDMANERCIFHSEGDLQYTLAKFIERQTSDPEVRLEHPTRLLTGDTNDGGAIDIWLGSRRTAIELKYKTVPFKGEIHGEKYELKPHLHKTNQ